MKKKALFLLSLLLLVSCSSGSKTSKCTGGTCKIGDHQRQEDIALINRKAE